MSGRDGCEYQTADADSGGSPPGSDRRLTGVMATSTSRRRHVTGPRPKALTRGRLGPRGAGREDGRGDPDGDLLTSLT